jgi:hypothetical protein
MTKLWLVSELSVAGQVVTLPISFDIVTSVRTYNTGNYPDASAVAPTKNAVVTAAPTGTQVQQTAPNQLTFGAGQTLDATYGSIEVEGLGVGQGGKV